MVRCEGPGPSLEPRTLVQRPTLAAVGVVGRGNIGEVRSGVDVAGMRRHPAPPVVGVHPRGRAVLMRNAKRRAQAATQAADRRDRSWIYLERKLPGHRMPDPIESGNPE